MQTQGYDMEGLAQANAVLTRSNYAVMAKFAYMTVTMNVIQAQLKHSPLHKPTKQGQKRSTTAGVAEATSLTGAKPAQKKNGTPIESVLQEKDGWQ